MGLKHNLHVIRIIDPDVMLSLKSCSSLVTVEISSDSPLSESKQLTFEVGTCKLGRSLSTTSHIALHNRIRPGSQKRGDRVIVPVATTDLDQDMSLKVPYRIMQCGDIWRLKGELPNFVVFKLSNFKSRCGRRRASAWPDLARRSWR